MSKDEIKNEINKVLDHLPNRTLEDILSFLKNLTGSQSISLFDRDKLEKILNEDKDLLAKLAK